MNPFDCAVVGAGIHGLCTAFWLRRRGHRRLVVIERHGPGHAQGSSHGSTRIMRSSYHDPFFVRLAASARHEGWPTIEQALGKVLRVPTPGVFFGPAHGAFGAYVRATLGASTEVEQIAVDNARRRFPLLRFEPDDAVLLDHTAAMLLAADTMQGLREWLRAEGVELRWHTAVTRVDARADHVELTLASPGPTTLRARRAVLATGPWLPGLVPPPEPLVVLRQSVGYFDVDAPEAACEAGAFPVWARIGRDLADFHYGLPSHAGAGLKAALHRTEGAGDDPGAVAPPIDEAMLLAVARQRFAVAVRGLRATERCLYTMTRDQGFRVGLHAPNLVAIAACSGHGFKFGPIVGRMAADLAAAPTP